MAGRGYDDTREYGGNRTTKPIPTEPPFKAYVGNLPHGIVQGDIDKLFANQGLRIKGIQIIKDRETDRFKGFCYVEFETIDDLHRALDFNGLMKVDDNLLRIDVAENKRNDRGGFNRGRGGNMGGGFQRRDGPPNRGYNDDFNSSMFQRGGGGGYNDRVPQGGGRQGGDRYSDRGGNRNYGNFNDDGGNRNWNRGGGGGGMGGGGMGGGGGNYGNKPRGMGGPGGSGGGSGPDRRNMDYPEPQPPADTAGRKKLQLQPRTVQAPVNALAESTKNSSIYGGARPREEKFDEIK